MPRSFTTLLATVVLVVGACSSSNPTIATSDETDPAVRVDETLDPVDDADVGEPASDTTTGDEASNSADDADTGGETTDADPGDESSGGFAEYRSPIAEFLGTDFGDRERTEAEFQELEAQAEAKTAACMQEQGFKYVPRDVGDFMIFGGTGEIEPGSDAWIETYGFGITTQRFPQSMVGPDLIGIPDEQMGGPLSPADDPNQEYVDSLSEGAREAYYLALWGEPPDFDPSSMTEEEMNTAMVDFVPSGCANEAREELFNGGGFGPGREFYETFGDEMQNLYERVESDPRIVAVQTEVSECVAARGLDWTGRMEDLFDRWESDLNRIGMANFGDPFEGTGLNPEEMSQEEINDFFETQGPPQLAAADKALLGELQREEVALAIAVRDCGGGPRDLDGLYNEVRIEYELRFLDENAEALEPFRNDG